MKDFILAKEDVVSSDVCNQCEQLFNKYSKYHTYTEYGEGENTKTTMLALYKDSHFLKDHIFHNDKKQFIEYMRPMLDSYISKYCTEEFGYLKKLLMDEKLYYSIFQLRLMHGPTRCHSDNLDPIVIKHGDDTDVYVRVATIILTLSESLDVLHFSYQNKDVPLTKGSMVLFPPYWNYNHHSSHDSKTSRFCFQTWVFERLTERHEHLKEESIL